MPTHQVEIMTHPCHNDLSGVNNRLGAFAQTPGRGLSRLDALGRQWQMHGWSLREILDNEHTHIDMCVYVCVCVYIILYIHIYMYIDR